VRVFRNDEITVEGIGALRPDQLCCRRARARRPRLGCCVEAINAFTGKLPILGVCLGHQAIGAALGGRIVRRRR
jgi:anthranilate synthase component 2